MSKRTIYDHFTNQEDLFASVLHESARLIAEAVTEAIERCPDKPGDLEADPTDRGALQIQDPARGTNHFTWLVLGEISARPRHGATPLPDNEVGEIPHDPSPRLP